MNNENLEVLEMDKNPNYMFNAQNNVSNDDMNDDFFDDDLVDLDFNGLDTDANNNYNKSFSMPSVTPINDKKADVSPINLTPVVESVSPVVEEKNAENTKEGSTTEKTEEANKVEGNAENKDNLDNSYVLSNFDVLFDSLYNDVVGANNLISDLIEKKSSLNRNEKILDDFKEKFEKEKEDFRKFVEEQKKAIDAEKKQALNAIEDKKKYLRSEEAKFNEDCEAKKKELSLMEQSLNLEKEKFETEKNNLNSANKIELDKISAEREKLEREKEEFERYRTLCEDANQNTKRELQLQQEQFAKYKELEQKKLDLEEKNLSQSCARFKELVSQFNSGFEQLPNEN